MATRTLRQKRTDRAEQRIRDEWGEKYLQFILYMHPGPHTPHTILAPTTVLQLSASPHITMKSIEDHPEIFDLTDSDVADRIMGNQNLTYAFVKKHQEINWDFLHILRSIDKPELLLLQADRATAYGFHSSVADIDYLNVPIAKLMRPCALCADWKPGTGIGGPCRCVLVHLLANRTATLEFIEKWIPHLIQRAQGPKKLYWNPIPLSPTHTVVGWGKIFWYPLSMKTSIKTIDANPHLPWDYTGLSQNKTLSAKYVRDHIDEDWNWSFVSGNTALTIATVREYPQKPWSWARISMSSSRRASDINENLDLPWDWGQVMTNKDILKTDDSVTKWLDAHKKSMPSPRNTTLYPLTKPVQDCIALESYLSSACIFTQKSLDRNLRFQEVVDSGHHLWNLHGFLWNTFRVEKEVFFAERRREYMSAYQIQQFWNKAITNPYCQVGINQVSRDYDKFFTEDGRLKREG